MNYDELQQIIFKAGVVGAGGAGFPTHKKLSNRIDTIIVNAVECEPLLKVDYFLLKKYMNDMAISLEKIVNALNAEKGIIAVKTKNVKTLNAVEDIKQKTTKIYIHEVRDIYPAGDEVVLTYEVTGRIIPEAAIPLAVGVMVLNAETLINIKNAIEGKAVVNKYLTVAGAVNKPITAVVPVGTPFIRLLQLSGLSGLEGYEVINGGPLMGRLCDPTKEVVTKTTKGIVVLPSSHTLIQKKKVRVQTVVKRASSACCQCRMCSDMCPRYLLGHSIEVHKTIRSVVNEITTDVSPYMKSQLCSGCGVCDYIACTQDIAPRSICSEVKGQMLRNNLRFTGGVAPERVRGEREFRLVPSQRIIDRCDLGKYDKDVIFNDGVIDVNQVRLPLKQHIGKPAVPVVKAGDEVKTGQLIAALDMEEMGSNIHSSIDGIIKQVSDQDIIIIRK